MHSRCDLCGATLQAGDAQPEALYVKCSTCGGLYALMRSEARPPRVEGGWKLVREGDVLQIRWPWFSRMFWVMAFSCLLNGGLAVAGFKGLLRTRRGQLVGEEIGWILTAVTLFFGYMALLQLINHTRIEASPRRGLQVRHGPLPWFTPSLTVDMREIRQLYGLRYENQTHRAGGNDTYELRVLSQDGSSRLLVGRELSREQVLFLERTLEEHLGIVDEHVSGELTKPRGT